MAYLLDPGEGKYALEDLALRYLSLELHVARPGRGHARPRRRRRRRRDRPPRRDPAPARRHARRSAATRASSSISTSGSSCRSCRCSRRWKRPASASTSTSSTSSARSSATSAGRLEAEIHAHAGEQFNVNSTPQLRTDPVREARPHAGEEDEDRSVDRRRLAAEDGRGAPDRRDAAAVPRGREAAQHLRRRAAAARAGRRPHPRDVQPARDDDRPHLGGVAEPAEHSGAHRRTGASCGARSSPTTAAACSPPTTRRSSCACSRTSPTTRA